jgi:hypothetical protein
MTQARSSLVKFTDANCADGRELACPDCGADCLQPSDNPGRTLDGDLFIPFACDNCPGVKPLVFITHKGSTILAWGQS